VLNFDGGDSCWNGPRRSAKVLVKCGVGTNLLSAEEPETCTYVLTMESHIACDEAFAEQHGLKLPSV
jgi:protein kinase C substrate 80K-H